MQSYLTGFAGLIIDPSVGFLGAVVVLWYVNIPGVGLINITETMSCCCSVLYFSTRGARVRNHNRHNP